MLVRRAANLPALLRLYRQLNPLAVAPAHPEGARDNVRSFAPQWCPGAESSPRLSNRKCIIF
jgi:hypothetical protein